jgi:hypothetical protein
MEEQLTLDVTGANTDTGAADAPATETSNLSAMAADLGVGEDMVKLFAENDPSFAADYAPSADEDKDGGKDGDAEGGEPSGDSPAGGDKGGEPQGAKVDDKNSDRSADGADTDYADDVISGLKGEDLKKLPESAREAIANFYQESQTLKQEAEAAKSRLDAMLTDPIIKNRAEMLSANKGDVHIRGLGDDERRSIADAIAGLDLGGEPVTPDESKELLSVIEKGLDAAARQMAADYAQQAIAQAEQSRRQTELLKQKDELLLGLSQFNKDWAVKETDTTKFYRYDAAAKAWKYNESHPEIEKWKNGIGAVDTWAGQANISAETALKMGGKALLSAYMEAKGLAAEREKKIAANARKTALDQFFRKPKGGTLNVDGGSAVVDRSGAESVVENGMDIVRLAKDEAYLDAMYDRHPLDENWINKVSEARMRGFEHLEKLKRKI